MAGFGLALLACVGVALILTGLPAYVVLIFAAVLGAGAAVASGSAPLALLGTLSNRLINLLESDLLQALPLYVLMGVLLNRHDGGARNVSHLARLLPRRPGTAVVAGLGLGALLGTHERIGRRQRSCARPRRRAEPAGGGPADAAAPGHHRGGEHAWAWSSHHRWC